MSQRHILIAATAAALLAVTTLFIVTRSKSRRLQRRRIRKGFQGTSASANEALFPAVAAVINNLLNSYPFATATDALQLPLFAEHLDRLTAEFRNSKKPKVPMLIEGRHGIGKTTALLNWVNEEISARPAIYLSLRHELGRPTPVHGDSGLVSDATRFRLSVERALGFTEEVHHIALSPPSPPLHSVTFTTPAKRTSFLRSLFTPTHPTLPSPDTFRHIIQALNAIRVRNRGRPSLLVLDDVEILFGGMGTDDDDVWMTIEFLGTCEARGLLEVIVCGEGEEVEIGLRNVPGFDRHLTTLHARPAPTSDLIRYLLHTLNPRLPPVRPRFTAATAERFADTIGGDLLELERFCWGSERSVEEFVTARRGVVA